MYAWKSNLPSKGDSSWLIISTGFVIITFSLIIVFSLSKYREYFISTINNLLITKEKAKASETAFKKLDASSLVGGGLARAPMPTGFIANIRLSPIVNALTVNNQQDGAIKLPK